MTGPKRAASPLAICFVAVLAALVSFAVQAQEQRVPGAAAARGPQSATDGLIVLSDFKLQQVVIVDPKTRKFMLYSVSGASTRPVIVRDIDDDFVAGADVMPVPILPTADVPGADLDDVPRPGNAIRVGFSHEATGTWTVDYVVRGSLPDLYQSIRNSLDSWRLLSERVSTTSRVAGTMQFESGPRQLTVLVRGYQPGFQQVTFQLRAP